MKRIIASIIFGVLLGASFGFAQNQEPIDPWQLWLSPESDDFATIRQQVEAYYANHDKGRGSGFKQWKRWELMNYSRLDRNGKVQNWGARTIQEYHRYEHTIANDAERSTTGYWNQVGPTNHQQVGNGYNSGVGRINCVAFHPTDPNTLWVGAPAGGLWTTDNLGATWTPLSDGLPSVGVAGIAVHPTDQNIIYILTGDGDGGQTRSIGVLKTFNGGETWFSTGLSWDISQNIQGFKLIMDPTNPDVLLAATSNGTYRTTNGGVFWSQPFTTRTVDIEFKPDDNSILYLHTSNAFFKSTTNGATWVPKNTGLPSGEWRGAVGVSPDDPSSVYVLTGPTDTLGGTFNFKGLFRSSDSGETFSMQTNTPNVLSRSTNGLDMSHQTTYDLALAVSPANESMLVTGGINIWKSTDQGNTMSNLTQWNQLSTTNYVHADIHNLDFSPVDGSLYACCDGGIYRSTDNGATFTDITSGMCIMQFYDIADFEGNANHIIGGTQDNGTNYKNSVTTTWKHIDGSDGSDVMIDHSNSSTLYMSANETLVKSMNSGASTFIIAPSTNSWANIDMDAGNANRIYAGYNHGIYRSESGGVGWDFITPMDSSVSGSTMIKLGVDNTNRMYTTNGSKIWRSDNAQSTSASWTLKTSGLPVDSVPILDIAVNPDQSLDVAVCFGGYFDTSRVYISDNGGDSWTNITGTLPNIPFNCIEWAPGSNHGLYLGGDVGVYYRDNNIGDWLSFRNGLPHMPVFDLEIHEATGLLRAGTFGRGLWETSVYTPCPVSYLLNDGNYSGSGSQGYRYFQTSDSLVSTRTIDGGAGTDVTYQAANYVHMKEGFEVVPGSEFHAYNAPCTTIPMEYSTGTELTGTYAGPMPGVIEEVLGIENIESEDYLLVYPNPSSGPINIEFKVERESRVSLEITDLTGRTLKALINPIGRSPGTYKTAFDLSDFSAGMYQAILKCNGEFRITRIAITR